MIIDTCVNLFRIVLYDSAHRMRRKAALTVADATDVSACQGVAQTSIPTHAH